MDTASFTFVGFGLLIVVLSNLSLSMTWRTTVLLLGSSAFLFSLAGAAGVLIPFAGFLLLGYAGVVARARSWSRFPALVIVTIVLAFLWLKKYAFLPRSTFLQFPYLTLGISYIFFRVLHLIIETGEGGLGASVSFIRYLTYTLNFTTLISGPIQRYEGFAGDLFTTKPVELGKSVVFSQIERLVRGFFKVNVLAMLLNMVHTDAFFELTHAGSLDARLLAACRVVVAYPFFLYTNFSGYVDIVIALARLMRIRLPENFDRPFAATSFIDFWNRWHITLSTWLKTYVYNPLLVFLMRTFPAREIESTFAVVCFFVTFFIIGIWHGPTKEFMVFGLLQGGGVAVNKLWQLVLMNWLGRRGYRSLSSSPAYECFGRGLTFTWFAMTLFWFWSTWEQIGNAYNSLGPLWWSVVSVFISVAAAALLSFWEFLRTRLLRWNVAGFPLLSGRYARVVFATAMAVIAFVVTAILVQPAPDIVYKAF